MGKSVDISLGSITMGFGGEPENGFGTVRPDRVDNKAICRVQETSVGRRRH